MIMARRVDRHAHPTRTCRRMEFVAPVERGTIKSSANDASFLPGSNAVYSARAPIELIRRSEMTRYQLP